MHSIQLWHHQINNDNRRLRFPDDRMRRGGILHMSQPEFLVIGQHATHGFADHGLIIDQNDMDGSGFSSHVKLAQVPGRRGRQSLAAKAVQPVW